MRIRSYVAVAALALTPALLHAQKTHPIEFGVDAGIAVTTSDPNVMTITVPVQSLRVGFYVTERVAIEPALTFNYLKVEGSSGSRFAPELGLLFDLTESRQAPQFFVRPFLGVVRTSFDTRIGENSTESITHAGAGLGVKVPFGSIERFAWRIEGVYDHRFEKDLVPAENEFGLRLGLSFFTK